MYKINFTKVAVFLTHSRIIAPPQSSVNHVSHDNEPQHVPVTTPERAHFAAEGREANVQTFAKILSDMTNRLAKQNYIVTADLIMYSLSSSQHLRVVNVMLSHKFMSLVVTDHSLLANVTHIT